MVERRICRAALRDAKISRIVFSVIHFHFVSSYLYADELLIQIRKAKRVSCACDKYVAVETSSVFHDHFIVGEGVDVVLKQCLCTTHL